VPLLTLLWIAMASSTPTVSVVAAITSSRNPIQRAVEMKAYHQEPLRDRCPRKVAWKRPSAL
jgi:hypothetical protein